MAGRYRLKERLPRPGVPGGRQALPQQGRRSITNQGRRPVAGPKGRLYIATPCTGPSLPFRGGTGRAARRRRAARERFYSRIRPPDTPPTSNPLPLQGRRQGVGDVRLRPEEPLRLAAQLGAE